MDLAYLILINLTLASPPVSWGEPVSGSFPSASVFEPVVVPNAGIQAFSTSFLPVNAISNLIDECMT